MASNPRAVDRGSPPEQKIIFMQCGPVRHRVDAKAEAIARPFQHSVIVRPTGFRPVLAADSDQRIQFQGLYRELISDSGRNEMICKDVVKSVREGRSPLVLTERREHLESLAVSLDVDQVVVLQGGAGIKKSKAIADRLAAIKLDEDRVLLATGRYIGEGFDDSRLDTLFLTLPVSWRGTIAQYVGRLHRLHDGKTEVRVYDYADLNVPMLSRMFDRRCQGYEAVTPFCYREVRFRIGRQKPRCQSIRAGRPTMQPPFGGSSVMESIRLWQGCSCMSGESSTPTPRELLEREVQPRRFSIADCSLFLKHPVDST